MKLKINRLRGIVKDGVHKATLGKEPADLIAVRDLLLSSAVELGLWIDRRKFEADLKKSG